MKNYFSHILRHKFTCKKTNNSYVVHSIQDVRIVSVCVRTKTYFLQLNKQNLPGDNTNRKKNMNHKVPHLEREDKFIQEKI